MITSKYVILDTSEITSVGSEIDFTKLNNTSAEMLRKTVDGTKALVKYSGKKPSFLSGKTTYTKSQIQAVLRDPEGDWLVVTVFPS